MKQNLPGGSSAVVPPDPMPNSEVKRRSADGSVGSPHARVGNCQASIFYNKERVPFPLTRKITGTNMYQTLSDVCERTGGAVVQLVRIPACHAGGRGFEPRPFRHLLKIMPAKLAGIIVSVI